MTTDFPSGEISGLETLTIFWRSPNSIFRDCALASPDAANVMSAVRIPRRNARRANRAQRVVLACAAISSASVFGKNFKSKLSHKWGLQHRHLAGLVT